MINKRMLLPMALTLANDGEPVQGRTRLQKMVFLMQKELEKGDSTFSSKEGYKFIAYDYGPFSKELYNDIDDLVTNNDLGQDEEEYEEEKVKYLYTVRSDGISQFKSLLKQLPREERKKLLKKAKEIKSRFNNMQLSRLIEKVYSAYPDYATKSIFES